MHEAQGVTRRDEVRLQGEGATQCLLGIRKVPEGSQSRAEITVGLGEVRREQSGQTKVLGGFSGPVPCGICQAERVIVSGVGAV